jgi:hypothetical protein
MKSVPNETSKNQSGEAGNKPSSPEAMDASSPPTSPLLPVARTLELDPFWSTPDRSMIQLEVPFDEDQKTSGTEVDGEEETRKENNNNETTESLATVEEDEGDLLDRLSTTGGKDSATIEDGEVVPPRNGGLSAASKNPAVVADTGSSSTPHVEDAEEPSGKSNESSTLCTPSTKPRTEDVLDSSLSDSVLIAAADSAEAFKTVVHQKRTSGGHNHPKGGAPSYQGRGGRGGREVEAPRNAITTAGYGSKISNPYQILTTITAADDSPDDDNRSNSGDVEMLDVTIDHTVTKGRGVPPDRGNRPTKEQEEEEEEEATDSFPGWNLNDQRNRSGRYLLNMSLPPSEDPFAMILELVCQAWEVMKEVDSDVILYPWGRVDPQYPPISDVTTIPTDRVGLKAYINKVVWKIEGGSISVELWIGHTLPLDKFKLAVEPGLKSLNMNLYPQLSQTKAEMVIGWLYGSTQFMDTVKTAEYLSKKVGIKLWLRWSVITMTDENGRYFHQSKDSLVRALHVIVDEPDRELALVKLADALPCQ